MTSDETSKRAARGAHNSGGTRADRAVTPAWPRRPVPRRSTLSHRSTALKLLPTTPGRWHRSRLRRLQPYCSRAPDATPSRWHCWLD